MLLPWLHEESGNYTCCYHGYMNRALTVYVVTMATGKRALTVCVVGIATERER